MCEHDNVIDGSTYKWRLTPEYSFGVGDDSKTMAHAFTYVIPQSKEDMSLNVFFTLWYCNTQ